jgi:hypothetical protein
MGFKSPLREPMFHYPDILELSMEAREEEDGALACEKQRRNEEK